MRADLPHIMSANVDSELVSTHQIKFQSLGTQIGLVHSEADTTMEAQREYHFDEAKDETEDDQLELEDIEPLPPLLKAPRLPQGSTSEVKPAPHNDENSTTVKKEATPFVPPLDVPRSRMHGNRFNPIRPNTDAHEDKTPVPSSHSAPTSQAQRRPPPCPSRMYSLSVAESGDEAEDLKTNPVTLSSYRSTRPCGECRKKKQRCSHADHIQRAAPAPPAPKLSVMPDPSRNSQGGLQSASRIKKDGTLYKKIPHDRSKGLSMTASAVDYRERKIVQAQYQAQLAELLDPDIVSQVETEGGITPLGRLFKAGVRMMERVMDERVGRAKNEPKHEVDAISPRSKPVIDATGNLEERAKQAEEKLATFKQALRDIMVD